MQDNSFQLNWKLQEKFQALLCKTNLTQNDTNSPLVRPTQLSTVLLQKKGIPIQQSFLVWTPELPNLFGYSSFGSYLTLKNVTFLTPLPYSPLLIIFNNPPWRGYGTPLILDKAGQSFSSWNCVLSILLCCCRNLRSLCSPSSPLLHTVTCKESLWSDKCRLPSDSEEDRKMGWSLSLGVLVSFLFVAWSRPLAAIQVLLLELCLLFLDLFVCPVSAVSTMWGLFLWVRPLADESTACTSVAFFEIKNNKRKPRKIYCCSTFWGYHDSIIKRLLK